MDVDFIAEPLHRKAPLPVHSGVSFRSLPKASLNEIVKVCDFYEDKAGGKYSNHPLAGRYLTLICREVRGLVGQLSELDHAKTRRIQDANRYLKSFEETFSEKNLEGLLAIFNQSDAKTLALSITPKAILEALIKCQDRIEHLETAMAAARREGDSAFAEFETAVSEHHRAAAGRVRSTLGHYQAELDAALGQLKKEHAKECHRQRIVLTSQFRRLYRAQESRFQRVIERFPEAQIPPPEAAYAHIAGLEECLNDSQVIQCVNEDIEESIRAELESAQSECQQLRSQQRRWLADQAEKQQMVEELQHLRRRVSSLEKSCNQSKAELLQERSRNSMLQVTLADATLGATVLSQANEPLRDANKLHMHAHAKQKTAWGPF